MKPHNIPFLTATIHGWKKLLKHDKYKQMIVESMSFLVKVPILVAKSTVCCFVGREDCWAEADSGSVPLYT